MCSTDPNDCQTHDDVVARHHDGEVERADGRLDDEMLAEWPCDAAFECGHLRLRAGGQRDEHGSQAVHRENQTQHKIKAADEHKQCPTELREQRPNKGKALLRPDLQGATLLQHCAAEPSCLCGCA
jgi:hypothetical protein